MLAANNWGRRPEMSASSLLLFGLGRLSTLLSFSVRLKISLWRCCLVSLQSPSGICSQIRSAYMGGVSAVLARLVVPARPVQNMPKCRRPSKCWRPPTFWPFFLKKSQNPNSAHKCPITSVQVRIESQKLSKFSCITSGSLKRGYHTF